MQYSRRLIKSVLIVILFFIYIPIRPWSEEDIYNKTLGNCYYILTTKRLENFCIFKTGFWRFQTQ